MHIFVALVFDITSRIGRFFKGFDQSVFVVTLSLDTAPAVLARSVLQLRGILWCKARRPLRAFSGGGSGGGGGSFMAAGKSSEYLCHFQRYVADNL